jgi:hypothetical protein
MKGFQRYSLIDNVDYKRSSVNKERMIDLLIEVDKSQRIINKEKRKIIKGRREIREEKKN